MNGRKITSILVPSKYIGPAMVQSVSLKSVQKKTPRMSHELQTPKKATDPNYFHNYFRTFFSESYSLTTTSEALNGFLLFEFPLAKHSGVAIS